MQCVIYQQKDKQCHVKLDGIVKSRKTPFPVIPAKAGIQYFQAVANPLNSGFHRSDDFQVTKIYKIAITY